MSSVTRYLKEKGRGRWEGGGGEGRRAEREGEEGGWEGGRGRGREEREGEDGG